MKTEEALSLLIEYLAHVESLRIAGSSTFADEVRLHQADLQLRAWAQGVRERYKGDTND